MATSTTNNAARLPLKWAVAALWLVVIISALGVVGVSHNCRALVSELTELKRDYNNLQVTWGQWLLEEASQASLGLVEQKARKELDMRAPRAEDIVVVRP